MVGLNGKPWSCCHLHNRCLRNCPKGVDARVVDGNNVNVRVKEGKNLEEKGTDNWW